MPAISVRWTHACLWVVAVGLLNLVAYTVAYGLIGGDAHNGFTQPGGRYVIRGHFLSEPGGREKAVSASLFIYSYVHSISLWVTFAAVLLAMLVLCRPLVVAALAEDSFIRGDTLIWILASAILLFSSVSTAGFIWSFADKLSVAAQPG